MNRWSGRLRRGGRNGIAQYLRPAMELPGERELKKKKERPVPVPVPVPVPEPAPKPDYCKIGVGVGIGVIIIGIIVAPEVTVPAMCCAAAL